MNAAPTSPHAYRGGKGEVWSPHPVFRAVSPENLHEIPNRAVAGTATAAIWNLCAGLAAVAFSPAKW